MSGFMKALAMFGSGAGGYVQGLREKQQMDIAQQNADWEQYLRGKQQDLDTSLKGAASPTTVQAGGGALDQNVNYETVQSNQVGDTKNNPGSAIAPGSDSTPRSWNLDTSPKSVTGPVDYSTPSQGSMASMQSLMSSAADPKNAPTWSAGGKTFATPGDAQSAATDYNSNAATEQRVADAYLKAGLPDQAMQHRQNALAMQKEGALDFIQGVRAVLPPDPSALKDANGNPTSVNVPVPQELIDTLNKTGPGKITWKDGYQLQAYENPNLPGHTDARIVDQNGKVLVPSINAAEGYIGMNLGDRTKLANETTATAADAQWKQLHGQAAMITANAMQTFRDAEAKKAEAQSGNLEQRMSDVDKLQLGNVNKQIDSLQNSINTAQAQGMWDPTQPNSQQMQTTLAVLRKQQQSIIGKYVGQSGAPADPLGLRDKTNVAPATSQPGGQSQAGAPSDNDRVGIFNQEFRNTLGRIATAQQSGDQQGLIRAQGDLEALKREMQANNIPIPTNGTPVVVPGQVTPPPNQGRSPSAPAKSTPQQQAPQSARTIRGNQIMARMAARAKADADPDVIALQKQLVGKSGRSAIPIAVQLNQILRDRYGLDDPISY